MAQARVYSEMDSALRLQNIMWEGLYGVYAIRAELLLKADDRMTVDIDDDEE